jgi:alkanesulfonate monooxygenase SsuD/methylene tetrahydromethanopterin reductase-like flavin-dependent oxidoreductase (luciferase family)
MKHALFLPPFGELSNPRSLMEIATGAEESGWDGLFLWDHILRPPEEPQEIADVWITLAAIATSTRSIRIGPMVTPTTRRRPQKLAREAITLDWLSDGRLTMGLGLGVDSSGELSRFGETVDPVRRGDSLDEAAALLELLWSGREVDHRGTYYQAKGVRLLPPPLQTPRIPMWFAARGDAVRPVRRAARYDGLFAIEIGLDGLERMIGIIDGERGNHDGFDIAVILDAGAEAAEWEAAGATWAMRGVNPGEPLETLWTLVEGGPNANRRPM